MARKGGQPRFTAEAAAKQSLWNKTADAGADGFLDWDFKEEQFVAAIKYILASGCALMIGTTRRGNAVSLTIYEGEDRISEYPADSRELDAWTEDKVERGRAAFPR